MEFFWGRLWVRMLQQDFRNFLRAAEWWMINVCFWQIINQSALALILTISTSMTRTQFHAANYSVKLNWNATFCFREQIESNQISFTSCGKLSLSWTERCKTNHWSEDGRYSQECSSDWSSLLPHCSIGSQLMLKIWLAANL